MSSTPLASPRSPLRHKLRPVLVIASMIGLTLGVVTPVMAASTITLVSGGGSGEVNTPDPNVAYSIPVIGASGAAIIRNISGGYGTISGTRWINTTGSTGIDQSTILSTDYSTTFSLPAGFADPSITIQLMADNAGTVFINGVQFGQQPLGDIEANFGIVSTASRYSGNVSHRHWIPADRAAPGMSSTPSIKPISQS